MKLWRSEDLDQAARLDLMSRSAGAAVDAMQAVRPILEAVRNAGDKAVAELSVKFDGIEPKPIWLGPDEIARRAKMVEPELLRALGAAARNIELVHRAQLHFEPAATPAPGIRVWREARPIDAVGLYVPGGSAVLPSTALMLAIPARVAGCTRRVLATPPGPDGGPSPVVCAAAELAGVSEIYCAGGAQAIAAMAFGTETLGPVDKIFGPGNRYVAAAKRLVSVEPQGPAMDLHAGPSELLVIADASASPAWVASDLLAQAEHDADAVVTLLSESQSLLDAVLEAVAGQLESLPRAKIAEAALSHGAAILVRDLHEAVELANDLAPEHLSLQVADPASLTARIRNAGAVFLGPLTPEAAGDYATGGNHTLPTGRAARHSSGLGVNDFQRWITFHSVDREGLQTLAPVITTLARAEGLEAHARSIDRRLS
jgi:histidinol dehydrogenase